MQERLERSRQKLRALAAELTRVEERERRVIATHLHDQIGAVLAMTKVKIAALRQMATDAPLVAGLDEVRALVGEAVNDTRNLTWELSPPILYQLGLGAALEWLGEEAETRHSLRVKFSEEGTRHELSDEGRFFLFSAARELLQNVVKHARARNVDIVLRWTEADVCAEVRDDGNGFDVSEAEGLRDARRSFGLFNIQERASGLGGRLAIVSSPQQGTTATVVLPFGEADAS
jgi:signal transduction histidine kinase